MAFNVLIVDDSSSMRAVIKKIVTLSGFKVDQFFEAQNGRLALELLSRTWIDIVLSDLNMPEMGGLEMLAAMKRDNLLKDIPVIIITTEGSDERKQMVCTMGARGFIKKPFLPEKVREMLYDVLGVKDDGNYGKDQEGDSGSDF
ncbi:MAG: response regulator [Syntrophales bacterium]